MLVACTGLAHLGYQDSMERGNQKNVEDFRQIAGLNLKLITHIESERIEFTAQGLAIKLQQEGICLEAHAPLGMPEREPRSFRPPVKF